MCVGCKKFGHFVAQCKKKGEAQVWQKKSIQAVAPTQVQLQQQKPATVLDNDGFPEVVYPPRNTPHKSNPMNTSNAFQLQAEEKVIVGDVVCGIGIMMLEGVTTL